MTRDIHSSKGSDNLSEKPPVTIKNLVGFTMKLQNNFFEINDKFEHMIDKIQQDLDAWGAKEKQQDALLQKMSNTLIRLNAQNECSTLTLGNDDARIVQCIDEAL